MLATRSVAMFGHTLVLHLHAPSPVQVLLLAGLSVLAYVLVDRIVGSGLTQESVLLTVPVVLLAACFVVGGLPLGLLTGMYYLLVALLTGGLSPLRRALRPRRDGSAEGRVRRGG